MKPSAQEGIARARERGITNLAELLELASGSPVDVDDATELANAVGIQLADTDGDPWEHMQRFAEEGPEAYRETREGPAPAEELAVADPATVYLGEISRTPLLTADEEVELAQERDAGRAAAERLAVGVADADERADLGELVRRGEAARRRLIEANLRLVVSVAKKYLGRGLSFLDLVQEGNLGLQKAVDKFDWRKGFRFSTYAYWWIRQAVGRAVSEQARTIRLPAHVFELLSKIYSAARHLHSELGRRPTVEEIAEQTGHDVNKVRDAFRAAQVPISLELPVGEDATSTLGDLLADLGAPAPAEEAEDTILSSTLSDALAHFLTPREAEVLKLRFGLDRGGEERTLGEVGDQLGISRERARQIEAEALGKLRRAAPFRDQFRDFVG
ncbi:MAG TPA: sigma-70 family RNA polymerase sigma factor [Chloroflexota bacterium]|jgi:RNA polymerase primary sigma factor|nr:sigma-70 family RNA polymerase sigma factor [Chloroflexota bacterium]